MINFTLPVIIDFTNLLKSVNQVCRTQQIMTQLTFFGAVLILGKSAIKHEDNHSDAILLWGFE